MRNWRNITENSIVTASRPCASARSRWQDPSIAAARPAGRSGGASRQRSLPRTTTPSHRRVEQGPDCRPASSQRGTSPYTWDGLRLHPCSVAPAECHEKCGTRREFLDPVLFWHARDLERTLGDFQASDNGCLRHSLLIRPRFVVRTATRTSAAQLCQALCAGRSRECARPPQEGVERDRAP